MDDDFDFFNRFVKLLTCSLENADVLHSFLVVFASKIMFLFFTMLQLLFTFPNAILYIIYF